jgi:hypothetical protein
MSKTSKEKYITSAHKGDLVQIHKVILTPEQRPADLPAPTKAVPYEAWIKGFLLDNKAKIGDTVRIETFIGRELSGTLVGINPVYDHNFGKPRPELLSIGKEVKRVPGKQEKA